MANKELRQRDLLQYGLPTKVAFPPNGLPTKVAFPPIDSLNDKSRIVVKENRHDCVAKVNFFQIYMR